ncbi:hypothetical protein CLAIMM_12410 [Cladophialophora immunda]|nr:hypothetical protein CLAIMM_12410 [Cladophialophora immunda]
MPDSPPLHTGEIDGPQIAGKCIKSRSHETPCGQPRGSRIQKSFQLFCSPRSRDLEIVGYLSLKAREGMGLVTFPTNFRVCELRKYRKQISPNTSGPSPLPVPGQAPSSHLTQGLLACRPASGRIWPEDKRNTLEEAAVHSLESIPENAHVELFPANIHAMLDENPSYIDLCETLKKNGLKFQRSPFARQLLGHVPYLNGSNAKSQQLSPAAAPAPPNPAAPATQAPITA